MLDKIFVTPPPKENLYIKTHQIENSSKIIQHLINRSEKKDLHKLCKEHRIHNKLCKDREGLDSVNDYGKKMNGSTARYLLQKLDCVYLLSSMFRYVLLWDCLSSQYILQNFQN